MIADYKHCEALVRERDRERFLSALFAPAEMRPNLYALYAFDLEILHVPDAVREPMAGEIRFQWWREALAGERSEEAKANPVAAALLDTMSRHGLPAQSLLEIIDARQFDLLGHPMESRSSLGAYLDATVSRLIELGARILDSKIDAKPVAKLAGAVIGVTRLLRNFARDVSKGRLFVPLDLLAAYDVHTASVLAGENSDKLRAALAELRQSAQMELAGGILTLYLPESLVVHTRGAMVDALSTALERKGVVSVRLDASALVNIDTAGISALVRAARITRERTGKRLVLARCSLEIVEALTETAVLPFEIGLDL